jgi:hypothetical protein
MASAWYDISVNEVIVYSTVLIFGVVIFSCAIMWLARPRKFATKSGTEASPARVSPRDSSEGQEKGKKKRKSREGISSHSDDTSLKSSKSSKSSRSSNPNERQSRKGKKKPIKESDIDYSEESSLLGGLDSGTKAAEPPKSAGDDALAKTLLSVLDQGMTLTLYSFRGGKQVHISLVNGCELRWRTLKLFAKKGKHLDLHDVMFVNTGKQTKKFHLPQAGTAVEDLCFSLITSVDSLDFEASSKVERDALVQGFTILVSRLKEKPGQEGVAWQV